MSGLQSVPERVLLLQAVSFCAELFLMRKLGPQSALSYSIAPTDHPQITKCCPNPACSTAPGPCITPKDVIAALTM